MGRRIGRTVGRVILIFFRVCPKQRRSMQACPSSSTPQGQCRAVGGTAENSPGCNPGALFQILVRLAAGRLNCFSRRRSISVVPQTTRDSDTQSAKPEFHSGLLSTVPPTARHSSRVKEVSLMQLILDSPATCVFSTMRHFSGESYA